MQERTCLPCGASREHQAGELDCTPSKKVYQERENGTVIIVGYTEEGVRMDVREEGKRETEREIILCRQNQILPAVERAALYRIRGTGLLAVRYIYVSQTVRPNRNVHVAAAITHRPFVSSSGPRSSTWTPPTGNRPKFTAETLQRLLYIF